ncbi:MAG TPA: hypothetical protein VEO91_00135 [Candidatus Limnocylindria bacterium]|nr:hypothetical protein [Candidatus Limnocylindria bacterium]
MDDSTQTAAAAPGPRSAGDWRDAPDAVAPTVLLLGGLFTSPLMYRAMRRRLLERGAAEVVVANIWLPDWLIAMRRGMGAILTRSGRALLRAVAVSAASPDSRGAPLLVVGHSAGGLTARLLTSPEPFMGRKLAAARRIGAVVTLGSPHEVAHRRSIGRLLAARVTGFADQAVPGSLFAPTTGYLAVSSRFVVGQPGGNVRERAASMLYRGMLPLSRVEAIDGDGLVPVRAAGLADAEALVLDGIVHGQLGGSPWYGSPEAIDIWWPRAVEVWRAALKARLEGD